MKSSRRALTGPSVTDSAEGLVQDAAEEVVVVGALVRLLGLTGNLRLADHHGIQRRSHRWITDS